MMLSGTELRVLVATRPVDFRKQADTLAALVQEALAADPYSGAVYVFRAKRTDRVKLLWWDGRKRGSLRRRGLLLFRFWFSHFSIASLVMLCHAYSHSRLVCR